MTGEKNRYKTHEQLWKLEDGELSTPQHDELILQLLTKKNAEKLFKHCYPYYKDVDFEDEIHIACEVPITSDSNFIIGYLDLLMWWRTPHRGEEITLIIEVKPKVKSFGDTLRQIKTYMYYCMFKHPIVDYILYSPDTTFKTAFETQGIKLITPSDLGLK